jgi:hypothetical protein
VLIALIAAVALIGVRFTILRPNSGSSGSTPASATAPGQTGLESAIDKANHAVGVSKTSAKNSEQAAAAASGDSSASTSGGAAASAPTAKPTVTKAAKPAVVAKPVKPLPKLEPGDRSGPILRDLQAGKVVVALFYNPHSADDNAALRAVRSANRHHGRVVLHSIPIKDVGNYNALTSGVQILEAPTVLVMGPDFKARTIVGYTEVKEIDQTVGDVGGKGFTAHAAKHLTGWAAKASNICQDTGFGIETSGTPTDLAGVKHTLARALTLEHRDRTRVAAVPAVGAKQRAAKHALLSAYAADAALLGKVQRQLKAGAAPGAVLLPAIQAEATIFKQYRPALHAVGERHCLG